MIGVLRGRLARASILLSPLCAVLLATIYIELDQPIEPPAKAAVPAAREPDNRPPETPRFAMPPLRSFADVLARPPFTETRRPPIVTAPASDTRSSAFILVGIVISAHERLALIEHGQPPHVERLSEGQEIDGWSVEKILPDRVVLGRADARIEVKAKDASTRPGQPRRPGTPVGTVAPADTSLAVFDRAQLGGGPAGRNR